MINNKEKIQDLIEKAETYRNNKLKPKPEAKSRLSTSEHEENMEAMLDIINQLLKYNERQEGVKR